VQVVQVVQDALTRLERAGLACFRRVQAGETPAYPRGKGSNQENSVPSQRGGNGAALDDGVRALATIGRVAVRWSRRRDGAPKSVTISREVAGWSACCSCADVPAGPLEPTGQETGMDLGVAAFAPLAEGAMIQRPRGERKADASLRRCARRVAQRKKGRPRRRKATQLLAQARQQVRRQRQDCQHKAALALVQQHGTI